MNAEILHDALNLLPGDLITATDKLRSAPRKQPVRWMRYVSMAACIALILYGGMLFASGFVGVGGSTEAAPESPAAMAIPENSKIEQSANDTIVSADKATGAEAEEAAPECDCRGDEPAEAAPAGTGLYSRYVGGNAGYSVTFGHKEGVEYPQVTVIRSRQELEAYYDTYRNDYDMDSLEDGCTHWTESFFAEHDLLLILTMENDGYSCPQAGYLNEREDDSWELTFPGTWEVGEGIDAETPWHIYVEIEKDLIAPEDTILLVFE